MGNAIEREPKSGPLDVFFNESFASIPGVDMEQIRKARRVQQVRRMWAGLVEQVFLDHTNSVYVFKKDGRVEMHVYVDESIYAAELNNRRELIKLQCREKYGEAIDDFYIHISHGKYKDQHPFAAKSSEASSFVQPQELDANEMQRVEQAAQKIDNPLLRECFKQAMISDLEWKKATRR